MRLFVAIDVPDSVRASIAAAQADLRASFAKGSFSWTKPDQFHLTLKFLGEVEDALIPELISTLKQHCANFKPLPMKSCGVGFFPNAARPRVVWAGLHEKAGQLPSLQTKIEDAVAAYTSEKREGWFHAHITIAKVCEPGHDTQRLMADWSQCWGEKTFGEWVAADVLLVQSRLSPKGATHTALASFPLQVRYVPVE